MGYAVSVDDELVFLKKVAEKTGIVMDPTYGGKALFTLVKAMAERNTPRKVLFVHTGG